MQKIKLVVDIEALDFNKAEIAMILDQIRAAIMDDRETGAAVTDDVSAIWELTK